MDSANLKADRLAVLDHYAHVLSEYSDAELQETIRAANGKDKAVIGDSCTVAMMKYKEAQIHGPICFAEHVERLVADDRHNTGGWFADRLKEICKKNGWKFSWMKDERDRLQKANGQRLSADAWKERLQSLAEKSTPDAPSVPEGFCTKG